MKAMILCGGQGTRLREVTDLVPKPMIEIGGRPILWHIMKGYERHGITEFILCLGYKANYIKEYFLAFRAFSDDLTVDTGTGAVTYHEAPAAVPWKVTLAFTGETAMTGARVKRASAYLGGDETFCLTYGDGVADVDVTASVAFHHAHGRLVTMTGVRPPSRFGEIRAEGDEVVSFEEKPQLEGERLVNGGFFVLRREFLEGLSGDDDCILEQEPLRACAARGQLRLFAHHGFWQCMDTFRDWKHLEALWARGAAPWKVW